MTFPTPNLAQHHTVNRLNQLFKALQDVKKKYETFAEGIKNRQLYQLVISLATENNQYATELGSLIRSLGGETTSTDLNTSKKTPSKVPESEKMLLSACEKNEVFLVKLYNEVLKEPYVYDSLKKMIHSQLEGIKYSFHRLQLLNTFQK